MGNKKDIMLITKSKLSGDSPRKSLKFKSVFNGEPDGVSVSRDFNDTNYWLNYKYAVGFSMVVGGLTYLFFRFLF
jgi:hypothetical protein